LSVRCYALVPPVLLRPAGFDAVDVDAEAEPPDGELGEIEEGVWAGEWYSVVVAGINPRRINSVGL